MHECCSEMVEMWGWTCYRLSRKIHWETPSGPSRCCTTPHWCRQRLRDVHRKVGSPAREALGVFDSAFSIKRTRSLEWFAAEARCATRFFRAELWINYPNKNRPQRLSSDLTSLTADGSWQLHRKAHKFMVRNAKSSHREGRWKLKEGKKFKWQKRDDLMRDSPRFVVFYAMKARFESSSEQDRLFERFGYPH